VRILRYRHPGGSLSVNGVGDVIAGLGGTACLHAVEQHDRMHRCCLEAARPCAAIHKVLRLQGCLNCRIGCSIAFRKSLEENFRGDRERRGNLHELVYRHMPLTGFDFCDPRVRPLQTNRELTLSLAGMLTCLDEDRTQCAVGG
jgi:hypothetical protein